MNLDDLATREPDSWDHPFALSGAYALHALDPAEHERFEAHVATCAACALEVREFTEAAARLGAAAGVTPPPRMREAVLARVDGVRQLPPEVPPAPPEPEPTPAPASRTAGPSGPADTDPPTPPGDTSPRGTSAGAPTGTSAGPDPAATPPTTGSSVRRRRWPTFALAASLTGTVALGGAAWWQFEEADRARDEVRAARGELRESAELREVLGAPDARTAVGPAGGGATATLVASAARDRAALLVSGLTPAPQGRVYQLWYADGGRMRPAGTFDRDGAVVLSGATGGATAVGITLEPAGGSPAPTTNPLMVMKLPA
ncbi:anti-sigma factor [Streptomyces sp. BI20]|uniref:anti-sigma factor n=1 Tax=Streptomyces sp. BI20 TaxID=3403460 RepID=UPI003C75641C